MFLDQELHSHRAGQWDVGEDGDDCRQLFSSTEGATPQETDSAAASVDHATRVEPGTTFRTTFPLGSPQCARASQQEQD